MEQYEAVTMISERIISVGLCDAVFLKGSLARGNGDEYSNIDMYVIVEDPNFEKFLDLRLSCLEVYAPILYSTFVYYRYPQVICIYDNGIHVNLYTTRLKDLSRTDAISIIYDPKKRLANYQRIPLSFNDVEIGELLDSFSLNALEFYNAYSRDDQIYAFRIASHLSVDLGTFLRIHFEPDYAKLGLKNYMEAIDSETRRKFTEVMKKLKIDTLLECVILMFVLIDSYIMNLPLKIAEHVNFDFYHFSKTKIMSIVR